MLLSIGNKACIADYEVNSNHVIFTLSDNVKSYLHFSVEQVKKAISRKLLDKTITKIRNKKLEFLSMEFLKRKDIYSTYN